MGRDSVQCPRFLKIFESLCEVSSTSSAASALKSMSSSDTILARCEFCNGLCDKFTTKQGPNSGQCNVRVVKAEANYNHRFWCCPKSTGGP
ncbi:uncharacterized protein LOC122069079 isoform X2 [Macadamia integrifolia]|uniref:uncharacterized protein LOC122069079 isoform X2 n=1 Tax=Macadamia integrifolia TaxID=60698 RepID=UPI001C4E87F5|nr:uncharacterized protein LOC122069079 isoform X2 [Macadamia integrifolia]